MKALTGSLFTMGLLAAVLGFSAAQASACTAKTYQELSDSEKKFVQDGNHVLCQVEDASSRWPKVYVYKMVKATPEEAMAVFVDYKSYPSFLHGLIKYTAVNESSGPKSRVYYKADSGTFLVGDPFYTLDNVVSTEDGGKVYRLDWKLVPGTANQASAVEGYGRFESMGTSTLFSYYNFVNPTSGLAGNGFVKGQGIKKMGQTVDRVVSHIEYEATQDRSTLQTQLDQLRSALQSVTGNR